MSKWTSLCQWSLLICCFYGGEASAEDWTRFRGPAGAGIAVAPGIPTQWTASDYAWQTILPGSGHSSPVVKNGQLYVTASNDDGTDRQLICLDSTSGKVKWSKSLSLQTNKLHAKNSFASSTPVISSENVVVAFADDDRFLVSAFNFDGSEAWTRDLGPFESQHGHGASPISWENLIIVSNDQDGPSSLVALDARSGETAWTTPRESKDASYSTPFVLERANQAPQLIVSCNATGVASLDPANGTVNWQTGPLPQRTVGSPTYSEGLIFQTCGQGGRGTLMIGVDPTLAEQEDRIKFEEKKSLPYVPTPIVYKGHLYLWNDNGVVVCMELKSFGTVWTERIGGNFSASPICVNGNLYGVSEQGEVVVVKASPQFKLLGRSSLGELSHATPAVADGRIYFRTANKVLCLAPVSSQ